MKQVKIYDSLLFVVAVDHFPSSDTCSTVRDTIGRGRYLLRPRPTVGKPISGAVSWQQCIVISYRYVNMESPIRGKYIIHWCSTPIHSIKFATAGTTGVSTGFNQGTLAKRARSRTLSRRHLVARTFGRPSARSRSSLRRTIHCHCSTHAQSLHYALQTATAVYSTQAQSLHYIATNPSCR